MDATSIWIISVSDCGWLGCSDPRIHRVFLSEQAAHDWLAANTDEHDDTSGAATLGQGDTALYDLTCYPVEG